MNVNAEELEALAQRASEVYEEEQRLSRARQAAQAAEEEAERQEWERQARESFEQALTLLERSGLPSVMRPWMRRSRTYPDSLTIQLRLPEPFGCSQCDWQITPREEGWYGIAGCERIHAATARSGWLPPESFVRWLLFGLEASRREHARWQALKAEDEVARAELAERQAEVLARACPWMQESADQTVTLYQVQYIRGMVATEEGELRYLEETGWSRSDQPDAEGYLTLEPTATCPERRLLKLDPLLHRPLFRKHVISLKELPWELTEEREEQIRGFQRQRWEEGGWLVRDPAGSVSISFRVPLPWVRALLTPLPPQDDQEPQASS